MDIYDSSTKSEKKAKKRKEEEAEEEKDNSWIWKHYCLRLNIDQWNVYD